MVELNEQVISEAIHEGESMTLRDLFDLIERERDGHAGVSREVLAAYARELADRKEYRLDAEEFLDTVDERTTATATWAGDDRFYELDADRRSQYPAQWHDRLGGSDDVTAYLRYIRDEVPEFAAGTEHTEGVGIAEDTLVHVLEVVGRMSREAAVARIEAARESDRITEGAGQHPRANISLAEQAPGDDGT